MYDGGDDDEEGVGQVPQEPHLHRLDGRGAWQRGGDREVDRGQDHHAGDVHCHWYYIRLLTNQKRGHTIYLLSIAQDGSLSSDKLWPGICELVKYSGFCP